jgi:hypothetical protein
VIPPRADLDDEGTRLLTYQRAHAASVDHLDALASVSAGIGATVLCPSVPSVPSGTDPVGRDEPDGDPTDDLTYRAALAALSGVVQRSLRDFLS